MNETTTLAFLGGDRRTEQAANILLAAGYSVFQIGVKAREGGEEDDIASSACESVVEVLRQALREAQVVIFPTPASLNDRMVNAPQASEALLWSEIREKLTSAHHLIGGKLPPGWRRDAEAVGARVTDLTDSDRLARKNALPTAEGALAIALQSMPVTLRGAKTVLIGYGRCAASLAPMLLALGSQVTVCARREEARERARTIGCDAIDFDMLADACAQADFICNTVPDRVMGERELSVCRKEVLLLDLASKPGGVDRGAAQRFGISVIWALGLPGKVAPLSAGRYLAEEIEAILAGEEDL